MRVSLFFTPTLLLAVAACNNAEQAEPEKKIEVKEESSEIADIYIRIRKLAAAGELDAASQLTDDPTTYMTQMTTALTSIGEAQFQNNMKNAALKSNIVSEKKSGDFAMLITNYSFKGENDKAANFFRKTDGGYVEIVNAGDDVPCQLVRDFYEAKGEKDAEIGNCTEAAVAKPEG